MKIELRKYGSEYLIINNFETWPKKCREYLDSKKEQIEKYLQRENSIQNAKIDKDNFDYSLENKYNAEFVNIKECFENLFLEEKQEVICYHATRLVSYEAENIKNKGLSIMNESLLESKIDNLLRNKIINFRESKILRKINFLKYDNQRYARENKIYFIYGNQDIRYTENNTSIIYPFYSNYGGEVIFSGLKLENSNLLEKLNRVSKPYIIICLVPLNVIENDFHFHIESIIVNYHKGTLSNVNNQFSIGNDLSKVIDIIEVNEKTEFSYD